MGRMMWACSALDSGHRCHGARSFFHGWREPRGILQVVGKLDTRFVRDVSIYDGTELVPGTQFTKTWRLRNSGTVSWRVHVAGDEMGSVFMASVESLAAEEEVDVSVDLIAPEQPGRHVSLWRLASSCGPKFGHRIWVPVQVVPQGTPELPVGAEKLITPVFLNHNESGLLTMLLQLPRELTGNDSRYFVQGDCTARPDNSNTSVDVGLGNPLSEPVETIRYPHINRQQSVSENVSYPKIQMEDTIFVDGNINRPKINCEEQVAGPRYPPVNSLASLGFELGDVHTLVDTPPSLEGSGGAKEAAAEDSKVGITHLSKDDEVLAAAGDEDVISTHSTSSSVAEVKQEMSDRMTSDAPKWDGVEADSFTLQGVLEMLEAMDFTDWKLNEEFLLKSGSDSGKKG